MPIPPADVQALFIEVCETDVRALKPGNVGLHGAGHSPWCAEDFMRGARACAPAICRRGPALGERILGAVTATRTAVDCNTNLGVVLLCAPLIEAVFDEDAADLQSAVTAVLERTTVADAALAYRAIRMAQPGGMGRVGVGDLADEPAISLREAMALARERDLIAAQYADGYRLLFDEIVPCLLEFQAKWGYTDWSVVGVYLTLLGGHQDSSVARKYGVREARKISAEAASLSESFAVADKPEQLKPRLLEFDRRLKESGINPGTTADLVIAGLFIAGLRALHQAGGKPLSRKDV